MHDWAGKPMLTCFPRGLYSYSCRARQSKASYNQLEILSKPTFFIAFYCLFGSEKNRENTIFKYLSNESKNITIKTGSESSPACPAFECGRDDECFCPNLHGGQPELLH